MSVMRAAKNIP